MSSFKAYFKKEWLEGIRTHKFLILLVGIFFFSISDPVMMKLLPSLLKGKFDGLDLNAIADLSQKGAMMSHMKSLYQITTFVIAIALMGIVAGEKADKTLTIPVSMGCQPGGVILAKWFVYSVLLSSAVIIGVAFAYFYAGLLFAYDFASLASVLKAGALYGLYYSFLVSLLILLSTMFSKPFITGISTLLAAYGMSGLGAFLPKLARYLPTQLLTEAKGFNLLPSADLTVSMIWTCGMIIIFLTLAALRLKSEELV